MKLKKIFIKLLAIILILNINAIGFISVGLAQEASESSTENTETGQSSQNTTQSSNTDQSSQDTNNEATTTNEINADVSSGENSASANTGDANINTEQTQVSSETSTNANEVIYEPMPWTTWTGEGDWQTRETQNTQTGADSTNQTAATNTQTSSTTNTNEAQIQNTANTNTSTGSNTASNNTGNAAITTQDASAATSIKNVANTNATSWTGKGDWTTLWEGEAINAMTGANSTNESKAEFNRIVEVLNQNNVDVQNLINSYTLTGSNTASQNTGNATITTGNSSTLAAIFNLANTNIFGTDEINILYQDIHGDFAKDIDLTTANSIPLDQLLNSPLLLSSENNTTGTNSQNLAGTSGSMLIDVTNNNTGNLVNDLHLNALTGSNVASDNTGNVHIQTGDADIIANLINFLNTNIFATDVLFGSINVYGDWTGNLILPEYSTQNTSLPYSTVVESKQTGANSTNEAVSLLEKNELIDNTNTGDVISNYDLVLETGGNSASDNTISGKVLAGSSDVQINEANYINNNILSDNPWWLILVNNLGSWTPVLISPQTNTQTVLDASSLTNLPALTPAISQTSASNSLTGSFSDNLAQNETQLTSELTNVNSGQIVNNVSTQAMTGKNHADRNTGSAVIESGDASVLVNTLNFLNSTVISPSFLVTVVNVFGSWAGDILNFGSNSQHTETPEKTIQINPDNQHQTNSTDSIPSEDNQIKSTGGQTNQTSNLQTNSSDQQPSSPPNIIDSNDQSSLHMINLSSSDVITYANAQVLSFTAQQPEDKPASILKPEAKNNFYWAFGLIPIIGLILYRTLFRKLFITKS